MEWTDEETGADIVLEVRETKKLEIDKEICNKALVMIFEELTYKTHKYDRKK